MTINSLERTYRAPWLPQFGLYKYESAENTYGDEIQVSVPSKKFRFGFLLLCGLLLIVFLITYFIVMDLSRTDRIGLDPSSKIITSGSDNYPATVVELLNETRSVNLESYEAKYEEINNETINVTTENPKNHRKFYTVAPQKLVFLPSRTLKPPKIDIPVRSKRRGDIAHVKRQNQPPKPFDHYMSEPHPAPFKRNPTRRNYGEASPLIINKGFIPGMQSGFRPIVGSYRRAKGTVPTPYYYQGVESHRQAAFLPTPLSGIYGSSLHHPSSTSAYVRDPFHKYKPPAPNDINMLVTDVPTTTRDQHLKMYNEQYLKNAHKLYQEVVKASRQKMNELSSRATAMSMPGPGKQRPFQLMLDVYPMATENEETTHITRRPTPKHLRFSPNAAKYNALNSINHEKKFNDYHHRVRLPHPYHIYQGGKYLKDIIEVAGSEVDQVTSAPEHPSQLVVHLNLYPKKKGTKTRKRVRYPIDYDAVSDEDTSEYFRRSSYESDESYIEDEEDMMMTDKKYGTRPLRSTGSTNKKRKKLSEKVQLEDDSKSIAINFNFSDPKKNCTLVEHTEKIIPMMDGNDNDVIFPSSSTRNIPKAHDFPYRYASMPPAHVQLTRPIGRNSFLGGFHRRVLKLNEENGTETTTSGMITTENDEETSVTVSNIEKMIKNTTNNEEITTNPAKN